MNDERLTHLEARYAWLERHVIEQDKAMVEMAEEIRRLRREIDARREGVRAAGDPSGEADLPEPKPPHY